jgi:hypothetical protein
VGYDSFIFGSSRALAFRTADWHSHIPGSVPLLYNANAESLFGVWAKVRLIDELGDRLANALLLVDEGLLREVRNSDGHLFIKDPRVSRESRAAFYLSFLEAYFSDFFFVRFLDYKLLGTYRPYMQGAINRERTRIAPVSNDLVLEDWDEQLERDAEAYYAGRRQVFEAGRRPTVRVGSRSIGAEQLRLLEDIREVFGRHGTNYRIVVSPNFDQVPLHRSDLAALCGIFGAEHVFDYSGVNEITADVRNYYEPVHFRPAVGQRILDQIYGDGAGARVAGGGSAAAGAPRPAHLLRNGCPLPRPSADGSRRIVRAHARLTRPARPGRS